MTVALRTLRVTADMDGRQYVAGMNQKIAADKAGAASSAAVGAALARTDAQTDRSGGVLASLSRQYIAGYGQASNFEKAVAKLGRAIEKGNVPLERVEVLLDGIYRKYNLTANAADLAAGGHAQLAAAVTNLNGRLALEEQALDAATMAQRRHAAAANDNRFQQRNLMFQLNDVFQSLALGMPISQVALQQGPQIAQIYGPGEGGIGRAFSETGKMITGTLTKFPAITAAVVALGLGFAGLTYEINQTTDVSVGMVDTVLAVFQTLGDYIYGGLKPAIDAISPWFSAAWNAVVAGVKWTGNQMVNGFRISFELLKFGVMGLPDVFIAAGEAAANGFIAAIEWMVQKALSGIKTIRDAHQSLIEYTGADQALQALGFSGKLPDVSADFSIPRANFGGSAALGRLSDRGRGSLRRVNEISASDPMGGFFSDVRKQAIRNATDDDKKKTGKTIRESDYERAIRRTEEQTRATLEETRVIDLSTFAKERQAAVHDILTAAQRDGLPIGKAFANAQELIAASSDALSPALAKERERILGVASAYAKAAQDAETAEEARKRFEENMKFARDLSRGFIDDVTGGLKEGMSVWEAFSKAALNALDKIASRLLDSAFDALFGRSGGGGGGGILDGLFGSLFGGGAQADPWAGLRMANGGAFNSAGVTAFAKGGAFTNSVVSKPTYFAFAKGAGLMGEAGPEAIMPLKRDASGRLGVSASNANTAGMSGPITIDARTNLQVSGNAQADAEMRAWADKRDAELPARVIGIVRDAQRRRQI